MKVCIVRLFPASAAVLIAAATVPSSAFAQTPPEPDFFAAAICQPAYQLELATSLYEAAEELGEPDSSIMGAAIYPLPEPIERDGFIARHVVFAGTSFGVLLDGAVASKVAQRYGLAPETDTLFGASAIGFARPLPGEQRGITGLGLISIIAREGPALGGRTLLACEFVTHEDRKAMKSGG